MVMFVDFSTESFTLNQLNSFSILAECRSLKALCRLALRHYLFTKFPNGYQRLLTFKSQTPLNSHLINYLLFNRYP